jgi:hypothetical protein
VRYIQKLKFILSTSSSPDTLKILIQYYIKKPKRENTGKYISGTLVPLSKTEKDF